VNQYLDESHIRCVAESVNKLTSERLLP